MKVAILAGGLGSRLAEETELKPKPMVEIGGKPILWHIMMHYAHYGFDEFAIALGYKGEVIAYDVSTGHVDWRSRLKKTPFSGGPAAGAGLVAAGTSEGEVVAFDADTGKERWRVRLNGEVLAAPAVW